MGRRPDDRRIRQLQSGDGLVVELKGSLLPGSLLEQLARLQAPMQKQADYGLARSERLRERIDAAWVRLKQIWEEYIRLIIC